MAIPVLIIGKSGTGKSASMRNCQCDDWNIIRVLNKPFPFRGHIKGWKTDDYTQIMKCLAQSKAKSIVIDDAGYLITNQFMRGHSQTGTGNAQFQFYNTIADHFWSLVNYITSLPDDNKIVYVIMHEQTDDNGDHLFVTQAEDRAVSKSPEGMFDSDKIPNDLRMVDTKIREYYGLAAINYDNTNNEEKENKSNAETAGV